MIKGTRNNTVFMQQDTKYSKEGKSTSISQQNESIKLESVLNLLS